MGHSHEFNIKYGLKVAGDSTFSGDLLPSASGTRGVGTPPIAWASGHFDVLEAGTSLYAKEIHGDGSNITNLSLAAADHSTLGNLTWSTAGHTIDADVVPTASGSNNIGTQALAFDEVNAATIRGDTIYGTDIYAAGGTLYVGGIALTEGAGLLDVDTSRIASVVDPVGAQDAATKAYVDAQVAVENLWDRTGTELSPYNASDDIVPNASGAQHVGVRDLPFASGVFDAIVLEKYSIIANKENVDIDTGTEVIDSFAETLGDAAIWDYMIKKGASRRAGNVVACWDGNADTTEYMETHTNDLGDTSDLTLSVDIDSNLVRLLGTAASDDWHCKVIRRLI